MIDATDPLRPMLTATCTSRGHWCGGRWLGLGQLCQRRRQPTACPDVAELVFSAFQLVQRIAAADTADMATVAVGDEILTVRALVARWLAPPESAGCADALELAGETGRCAACGWRCDVCGGADRAEAQLAPCRALNGRCTLSEQHVARCAPESIRWSAEKPGRGRLVSAKIIAQIERGRLQRKDRRPHALTARTRRQRRRLVRAAAKQLRTS